MSGASHMQDGHGIEGCILCGARTSLKVLEVARAPLHPFAPPAGLGLAPGFGTLDIVACSSCGHLYNAAFDLSRAEDLYAANVLTNMPVSPEMVQNLEDTARFVLAHAKPNPVVADVGGGSGALAVALAQHAREVHLVEPSRALSTERFAGTGVRLHSSMFPAASLAGVRFDVIVCRQVIEHVAHPAPFLAALRAHLAPGGVVYLELPRAEYIEAAASIVDFHYPHVHYFREREIALLVRRIGFETVSSMALKDGHDIGFVLKRALPEPEAAAPCQEAGALRQALRERRALGQRRLDSIKGAVALYGANAYAQALLGLYPGPGPFQAVLDDTPMYAGQRAYGAGHDIPIVAPSAKLLGTLSTIVITAYLHDAAIARKLERLGWKGLLYTVRADPLAGKDGRPPSLFGA
ncbi:MAG TPA: class I SAM-dependent methyltransferase [Hyphomicrobiaceae bacterium]|nr:class I SAM-dependent methyltransferase [Hyphomicrobiaceae bacterium]